MHSKFANNTKMVGPADILEERVRIPNDIDKLEKWSERNWMKLSKENTKY